MTKTLRLALILLAASVALHADALHFDSVSGTWGGITFAPDTYNGPYYISPYFGSTSTSGGYVLFCIDFDHTIYLPDQEASTVFQTLTTATFDSAPHLQFGAITNGAGTDNYVSGPLPTGANIDTLNSLQRYEAAMFLLNQELVLLQNPPADNARVRAVYQYAIWALFLQNGVGSPGSEGSAAYSGAIASIQSADQKFEADVNNLILSAVNVTGQYNPATQDWLLSQFTVVDATTNPNSSLGGEYQEFLHPNFTLAPAPEPGSIMLLGTVFAGVAWLIRRKRVG